jgi:hypothetical protein
MRIPEQEWKKNDFKTEEQFQAAAMKMISQWFPELRFKAFHVFNEWFIPEPNLSELNIEPTVKEIVINFIKKYVKDISIRFGARAKAIGNLPGVMDILILHNGILFKAELKLPSKTLTDSQKELHPIWNRDCPEIPVRVFYNLWDLYCYCKKIIEADLKIDFFPAQLKQIYF